jgi:carnitine O-acetyltransferase
MHGRTETARTVSVDSKAFVEAMGPIYMADRDDILAKKEKLKLLRQAAAYHHNYTLDACGGMGVDRHFLGLSLVRKDGEQPPDLFKDPVFERSKTWRLSTSGLPTTPGFGPVVEDGLGVGYGLHSNSCLFHISARKENKYVDRFCHELVLALKEMKGLLEADDDGITAQ